MNGMSNRRLQTINVIPASADAQNSANAQVQFTATGNFNAPPTPVTPLQVASWLSSDLNIATVDANGVAQCVAGGSGTVTISALASSGPDFTPMGNTATVVTGTARFTCP
jgi:uncharacterized protein YjdB